MKRIAAVVLSTFLFVLAAQGQDITNLDRYQFSTVLKVFATQQWTQSGITLQPNDTVEIHVRGIASTSGIIPQGNYWVGPEGIGDNFSSGAPIPNAASHSVIGRIGASGTPFYVGSIRTFKTNIGGTLYLGYNDNIFFDNDGYYIAFISVKRLLVTEAVGEASSIPTSTELQQNFPNPFNPSTRIEIDQKKRQLVDLLIYDVQGQLVRNLFSNELDAGIHSFIWDGRDDSGVRVATGTYLYQIQTDEGTQAKRMLLLK